MWELFVELMREHYGLTVIVACVLGFSVTGLGFGAFSLCRTLARRRHRSTTVVDQCVAKTANECTRILRPSDPEKERAVRDMIARNCATAIDEMLAATFAELHEKTAKPKYTRADFLRDVYDDGVSIEELVERCGGEVPKAERASGADLEIRGGNGTAYTPIGNLVFRKETCTICGVEYLFPAASHHSESQCATNLTGRATV